MNANELGASRRAEMTLEELQVAVPRILFYGTVSGKNVTVESRLPGVSLDVAWRHLSPQQIELMKQQCRIVSDRISNDTSPGSPSYVCSELNSQPASGIEELERSILFDQNEVRGIYPLTHNNMLLSNIVVNNHRIVGLIGWREAGYFGFGKADKVHRQVRVPRLVAEVESGVGLQNVATWADLYEGLPGAVAPAPPVKVEPSATNLDRVPAEPDVKPALDGTPEEHPTPKKVASLKNQANSRASSSDRSSPATSTKAPTKRAAPGTKKGIGRKTSVKKRKVDNDNESVDGRRSATPSSSRASKAPGKKQSSASLANSPAPEPKKKGGKKVQAEEEEVEEEGEEDTDDGGIFCICRKPDNHTWMIGCDGGCEDWFHGKCVNIDPRDAELIERYVCPNCKQNGKGWTTWKPMCRLEECRKPARFTSNIPSKYCSDEHGLEFMRQKTQHLNLNPTSTHLGSQKPKSILRAALNGSRTHTPTPVDDDSEYDGSHIEDERDDTPDDLGSRGGVLTLGDLTAVIMGVGSAEEFRKLGAHIVSPPESPPPEAEIEPVKNEEPKPKSEEENPTNINNNKNNNKLGLDVGVPGLTYTPPESNKLDSLRTHRASLFHRRDMLAARNAFLSLVRHRSKSVLDTLKKKDPKGGWKDICGFDSRLAWSDEEFDEWRLSVPGAAALESGSLDLLASSYPADPTTTTAGTKTDTDGDTAMTGGGGEDESELLTRGVCTKKRCERHKQWVKVQQQDIAFEERTLADDLVACEKEAKAVVERAVLRMWAENGDANANAAADASVDVNPNANEEATLTVANGDGSGSGRMIALCSSDLP
ncbi:putative PHD transcription factor [Aspergillus undulatus]|uniref:putative PHD transcription factor n=1 Tax=Aspergillus undulatus TaxID=1810928 RepID=UPI003CCE36CF